MSAVVKVPDYTLASGRLAALASFGVLDTDPEDGFDSIVEFVAQLFGCLVDLVSVVDRDRRWFKAAINFPPCETALSRSVCANVVTRSDDILVIPDLTVDPRGARLRETGDPSISVYAGASPVTREGYVLGSLHVIDKAMRPGRLRVVLVHHFCWEV